MRLQLIGKSFLLTTDFASARSSRCFGVLKVEVLQPDNGYAGDAGFPIHHGNLWGFPSPEHPLVDCTSLIFCPYQSRGLLSFLSPTSFEGWLSMLPRSQKREEGLNSIICRFLNESSRFVKQALPFFKNCAPFKLCLNYFFEGWESMRTREREYDIDSANMDWISHDSFLKFAVSWCAYPTQRDPSARFSACCIEFRNLVRGHVTVPVEAEGLSTMPPRAIGTPPRAQLAISKTSPPSFMWLWGITGIWGLWFILSKLNAVNSLDLQVTVIPHNCYAPPAPSFLGWGSHFFTVDILIFVTVILFWPTLCLSSHRMHIQLSAATNFRHVLVFVASSFATWPMKNCYCFPSTSSVQIHQWLQRLCRCKVCQSQITVSITDWSLKLTQDSHDMVNS